MNAGTGAGRLLVFGGSFDPPHVGHMNLLHNAMAAVAPTKVLVVPAGIPPHKAAGATPAGARYDMCACFLALGRNVEVSRIELDRLGKSYTVDTLAALRRQYPGWALYLSVGGDMLEGFAAWHRWREILALATLVATPRHAGELPALEAAARALEGEGGRVLFAPGPVRPAASSEIRAAIAAGDAGAFVLIPPPADAIARERGLYDH